jgi:hypothetical protein
MQANLEQIKQSVLHLPAEDFEKFGEWYESERRRRPKNEKREKLKQYQIERFRQAQEWMRQNRDKYLNQWVCLEGDRLIAHGADALKVHRQAKDAGIEIPYLEHIVEESDWGGW